MVPRLILLLAVVGGIQCQTSIQGFVYPANCAAPNQTTVSPNLPFGTQPPPIPTLPATFQTRVEVNIIDKGYTIVGEEYYDSVNDRAAVRVIQNNTMNYIVFDYQNDQILNVINGSCFASDLEYDLNNLLFGATSSPNGTMRHLYSTKSAIHFAKQNGLQYMGRSTIRGIPADHWQSCMTWPRLLSNFTLDYYFTARNDDGNMWLEPDLSQVVPLRAEAIGVQIITGAKSFHHIYEYFDFRNRIWEDDTVFETPPGMVCVGRKQTKLVPTMGPTFSFREEIIQQTSAAISTSDVWYDYLNKLVRYDYKQMSPASPFYTTNPVTLVHDYKTGIAYVIDRTNGNCTAQPIQNGTFDSTLNMTSSPWADQFYLQIKSPSQMFYLDDTYTYEGTRTVRGILCDVFISRRTDLSVPFTNKFNSTFEIYFLSKDWVETSNTAETDDTVTAVPIQLRITTPDWVGYSALYNIYNFNNEPPSQGVYDVTSCYGDENKNSFVIEFDGQYDTKALSQHTNSFLAEVRRKIQIAAHLSPLRIQNVRLHSDPSAVYVRGTLLDLPPDFAQFRKVIHNEYMSLVDGKSHSGTSASDCAKYCNIINQNGPCNSFDFCAATSTCRLYRTHAITEHRTSSDTPGAVLCDGYSRSVASFNSGISLDIGWIELKNDVYAGMFHVQFGGVIYKATAIDTYLKYNATHLDSKTFMSQFEVHKNKTMPDQDDRIMTGVSVDECAKGCIQETAFTCNSFSFSYNTGYCIFQKIRPDGNPNEVKYAALTDLYSRTYLSDYNKLPGSTVQHNSAVIYQSVHSDTVCAQLCTNSNNRSCVSFDFCPGSSTCYIGKTRRSVIPKANVGTSEQCGHYTRKYLMDFKQLPQHRIPNKDDLIIRNIPLDECAKLCVEEKGRNCVGFSFCAGAVCALSTAASFNLTPSTSEVNMSCHVYSRSYFDPQSAPHVSTTTTTQQTSSAPTLRTRITRHALCSSVSQHGLSSRAPTAAATSRIPSQTTKSSSTQGGSSRASHPASSNGVPEGRSSPATHMSTSGEVPHGESSRTPHPSSSKGLPQSGSTSVPRRSTSTGAPHGRSSTVTQRPNAVDCAACIRNVSNTSLPPRGNNCSVPIRSQQSGLPSNSDIYSGGTVGGIAIAMLLVGILVGGIGVFCVIDRVRRRSSRDEMAVHFARSDN